LARYTLGYVAERCEVAVYGGDGVEMISRAR
jgi:hypothetical protein